MFKGSNIALLLASLVCIRFNLVDAQITTTPAPLQAGQKYIVPDPNTLSTLPDYQTMIAQCSANSSTTACIASMNQFLSDVYLIVPDTKTYITNLNDQVTSNNDQATYKKNSLATLQTTVNTWIANLVKVTNDMNTADTTYFNTLMGSLADIAALRDEQSSSVFQAANTQKTAMLDRLSQLNAAATQFLSVQRDSVKNVADYVYDLFKNDQAIIGNTASTALAAEQTKADALQAAIAALRRNFQGNITSQSGNLDALKVKVASAKADADNKAADTRTSIATQIQSGLDAAMAAASTAFQSQSATVQAAIDKKRTDSYAQYDSIIASAISTNDALDTAIQTNISAAQTSNGQLSQLAELNINGAQSAGAGAVETLTSSQQKFQSTVNGQISTLNQTLSEYVDKVASTSKNVYGQSQTFMQSFSNLATNAAQQATGSMTSGAVSDATALSSLNSVIGGVSGSSSSQSSTAASAMADQVSSARDSATITSVKQVAALGDAINTLNSLISLLKGKLGYSNDKQTTQAGSIQDLLTQSNSQLTNTLSGIAKQVQDKTVSLTQSTWDQLRDMKSISASGKRTLESQIGAISRKLSTDLNTLSVKRSDVISKAQQASYSGAQNARQIAAANDGIAAQVSALVDDVNTKWKTVTDSNSQFNSSIIAAISAVQSQANAAADSQLQAALSSIRSALSSFSSAVNQTAAAANSSQNSLVATASSVATDLTASANKTQSDAAKLASDTVAAAVAAIASAQLVPPILTQLSAASHAKLQAISSNATSAFQARVDVAKADLIASIQNWASQYRTNSFSQLNGLNQSVQSLSTAVANEVSYRDKLFPGGVNPFSLSSDDFKSLLNNATSSVSNASNSLDSTYGSLDASLTSLYTSLSSEIGTINAHIQTIGPNVSAAISGATIGLQNQVNSDLAKLQSYGDQLVTAFIANRTAEERAASQMMASNKASLDLVIQAGNQNAQQVMTQFQSVSDSEEAKQATVADAMDDIVQSLISMSGNNAMVLQNIQNQFQALQSTSGGLTQKLNTSLTNAITAVSAASAKAAADMQIQIADQNRNAIRSIGNLGDRLSLAMDTLEKGSAEDLASLSSADADAIALAKAVEAMGDDAKTNIREMLQKILTGQTTVADVLKSRSAVNVAQMTTVSDVISGFITTMQSYISDITSTFDNEQAKLTDFDQAIPVVVNSYESARAVALANARAVLRQAQATAQSYATLVNATEADAADAIADARDRLSSAAVSNDENISQIKAQIKSAVEAVEDSQDRLSSGMISAAGTSWTNIVSKLRAFRTAKGKDTYSLSTEKLSAPTAAPRIVINI